MGSIRLNRNVVKRVLATVDWGWSNPGCILTFALDGDDRAFLIHQIYQTQRTIDWWIEKARSLKAQFGIEQFVCDPAEPAFIAQFNAARLNAVEAINDIAPGISAMQSRLRCAEDGRPRLYVYVDALRERDESRVQAHQPYCLEQEILEYVWPKAKDGQPIKEVPVKVNDHAMDCARYLCLWLSDLVPTPHRHIAEMQRRLELQQQRNLPQGVSR